MIGLRTNNVKNITNKAGCTQIFSRTHDTRVRNDCTKKISSSYITYLLAAAYIIHALHVAVVYIFLVMYSDNNRFRYFFVKIHFFFISGSVCVRNISSNRTTIFFRQNFDGRDKQILQIFRYFHTYNILISFLQSLIPTPSMPCLHVAMP